MSAQDQDGTAPTPPGAPSTPPLDRAIPSPEPPDGPSAEAPPADAPPTPPASVSALESPWASPGEVPPGAELLAVGPEDSALPRRQRRWGRIVGVGLLIALGLGAVGSGAAGLYWEHTRKPTAAEKSTAADKEIALRWRIRTVAEVFPPVVKDPDGGASAYRIGYAAPAPCSEAVDPAAAKILIAKGCRTVLRATYADSSRTLLATVAVVVMTDTKGATAAADTLIDVRGDVGGVRALAFPGTAADAFTDGARQRLAHQTNRGPYVFLDASGWADGRPKLDAVDDDESFTIGDSVVGHLSAFFGPGTDPCRIEGVRC